MSPRIPDLVVGGLRTLWTYLWLLGRNIRRDRCFQQANALAYTTLLSLVPAVAISFSIFQATGTMREIQDRAKAFILQNLVSESSSEAIAVIDQLTENVNSGALGILGTIGLVLISISLFLTIERSMNWIWRVRKPRSLVARITAFWFVITFGPVLIGLSIYLTARFQSLRLVQEMSHAVSVLVPVMITWAAFSLAYWLIPNTRVRVRAALVGGVIAGLLWEAAKVGFDMYMSRVLTYRRVYGSLGAIPIFLVWLYLTWFIVLLGAEAAYVFQGFGRLRRDLEQTEPGILRRDRLGLGILMLVGRAFARGEDPPGLQDLGRELTVGLRETGTVLRELERGGWLRSTDNGGWVPARPLDEIRLPAVAGSFGRGISVFNHRPALEETLDRILDRLYDDRAEPAISPTLRDLVDQESVQGA